MAPTSAPPERSSRTPIDGRHARRERSRNAVIDAAFELIGSGHTPPQVDQIAEGAGVSVSSIFRMFDGLDDLQRQALGRFEERYSELFDIDLADAPDRRERIRRYVTARVALHAEAGPIMRVARQRALDHGVIAEQVARSRTRLAEQTRSCFAPEFEQCTSADAANLAAMIDTLTAPEAFHLASAAHTRSPRQIAVTWNRAVGALVDEWCGELTADGSNQTAEEPTT